MDASTSLDSTMTDYRFPQDKLKRRLTQADKTPLVLVACGSFSPVTMLHLQLFALAERYVQEAQTEFEVVGNYMSPCSDAYGKSSLVPAHHRVNMCHLAIQELNSNVMVDEWEIQRRDASGRRMYTPTPDVLRQFDAQINTVLGGIQTADGTATVPARIVLLIGADLAQTMGDPVVWPAADMDVIFGAYGAFIVERPSQCDIGAVLAALAGWRDKIWVVPSFPNDVSSTKVRSQIQNGEESADLPKSVSEYIRKHVLYQKAPYKDWHAEEVDGKAA